MSVSVPDSVMARDGRAERTGRSSARALLTLLAAAMLVLSTALVAVLAPAPARAAGDPWWLAGVQRFDPTEATVYIAHGVPNDPYASDTQLVQQRQTSSTFRNVGWPAGWLYNAIAFHDEQRVIYAVSQENPDSWSTAVREGGHLLVIGGDGRVTDLGRLDSFTGSDTFRSVADRKFVNTGFFAPDGSYWFANTSRTSLNDGTPSQQFYRVTGLDGTGPVMQRTTRAGTLAPRAQDLAVADGYAWGAFATESDTEPFRQWMERVNLATGEVTQWDVTAQGLLGSWSSVRQYGAAWTYGNGNLGLKRNDGDVFQIDIQDPASATPAFTLVSTYRGPAAYSNDGTSWAPAAVGEVDLGITKTGPAAADPGGPVTWTLRVTNHSANPSSGYTVRDELPAGFTVATPTSPDHLCTRSGNVLTCVGAPLAAGASRDIVVTGTAATTAGTYTNTATVLGNEVDPQPANDAAAVDTNITRARLAVAKQVTAPAAHVGAGEFEVTYRVTVTNDGSATGTYAALTDTPAFDPALEVRSATVARDGGAAAPLTADAAGAFAFTTGPRDLAVGATHTYDVAVRFAYVAGSTASAAACTPDGGAPGTGLFNTATLTSADAAVATADACAAPPALPADLSLTKTGPAEVRPDGAVSWTLRVTNAGPGRSTGFTVTDTVPAGVTLGTLPAGCTATGNTLTCADAMPLAAGASRTLTLTGTAPATLGTVLENTASVAGTETDPDPGDNTSTATTTVTRPELTVAKSVPAADDGDPDTSAVTHLGGGDYEVAYRVTVANGGTASGTYTALTDTPGFASALEVQGARWVRAGSGAAPSTAAGPGPYPLHSGARTLAPGASETYDVAVRFRYADTATATAPSCAAVPGSPGAGLYNVATLTSDDATTTSAAACASPPALAADLGMVKTGPSSVRPDGAVAWTLRVTNHGPGSSTGYTLTDTVPAGVTLGALPAACTVTDRTVACTGGPLAAGESRDHVLTATAPSAVGATFTNTADVAGDQLDLVPANDTSSVTTTVTQADIAVTKTVPADGDDNPATSAVTHLGGGEFAVDYAVTVANNGTAPGTYSAVTDTPGFDARLEVLGATVRRGTDPPADLTPDAGGDFLLNSASRTLAVDEADTYTVRVRFRYTAAATTSAPACDNGGAGSDGSGLFNAVTVLRGNGTEVDASACTAPPELPTDLGITKDASDEVRPGGTIAWTLRVENHGPVTSEGHTVTDAVPAGVTLGPLPSACTLAGSTVTCAGGSLAVGGAAEYQLTATAPATEGATVVNSARVVGSAVDLETGNDTDTATTEVTRPALAVAKSVPAEDDADPATTAVTHVGGGVFETAYRITVTNDGSAAGSYATLTDTPGFDPVLDVLGASWTGATSGTADGAGPYTLRLVERTLAPGESDVYDLTVRFRYVPTATERASSCPTPPGQTGGGLLNGAAMSSADADTTSDTACVTPPPPPADLSVTKTGPAQALPDGTLTWTLAVTNAGPGASAGYTLTDTLPAGVTLGTLPAGCTATGNIVTCADTTPLAAGETRTRTLTATAPSAPGTLTNVASVAGDEADPDPSDNNDTVTTEVGQAAVTVAKSAPAEDDGDAATSAVADAGDGTHTVAYRVTVANDGTASGTYRALVDTPGFDADLQVLGATWARAGDPASAASSIEPGPWTLQAVERTLAAGESETYDVTVRFRYAATATATASACVPGGGAGAGLYNAVSLVSPAATQPAADACVAPPAWVDPNPPVPPVPTLPPVVTPTATPTSSPTPTGDPSAEPTGDPTADPSAEPTGDPSGEPTGDPSADPSGDPSGEPTTPGGPGTTPPGGPGDTEGVDDEGQTRPTDDDAGGVGGTGPGGNGPGGSGSGSGGPGGTGSGPGGLAVTGAPTLVEALAALALAGLGVALTVLSRRRAHAME